MSRTTFATGRGLHLRTDGESRELPIMSKTSEPARPAARSHAPASGVSKNRKRILVVDDEKDLLELVRFNLERNGYEVITAADGNTALELAAKQSPDLIVLDLMLPGLDGTEVARRLKADAATASIPIVMLTAKSEETDVVVGLTLGADDYVTKPFSMKILLARLNTVLRRRDSAAGPAGGETPAILKAGPLTIDTAKHDVSVNGTPVRLTLTEFKLLTALVAARGRVLTRDQLMDKAMGTDVFVTDRAIDVHITSIRKKLGEAAYLVHTVRGVGYRLHEGGEAE
ncbi:MAG: response regulator transcription factor [Phycisphaerae bacterium]|nr:response regulator transcription factor [Phycisphaerae bacterium]MDW8263337.1 response regulator transcription factor [Phycisphaerales bacterium]